MPLGTPPERKPLLKYLMGRGKKKKKNTEEMKQCKGGWGEGTLHVEEKGCMANKATAHLCTGQC